ncbi:MAG TPA: MerR family transcriptional regulator [Candidatus Hydrogenedens sp.]|nr:MerR family transcriptional regulator [Candidatus Hydrogenedens sp.]HOK09040.1 MerR family transcriptional regulator [Candidatus Hydrogenedens sp.]HOL19375.1 MerR family transcriptional regulator [Candidatus Hydrogenedens sp.]HPP58027.1 MerR family transcriptional regulator [Candidatus Hydrogenedens sp.]
MLKDAKKVYTIKEVSELTEVPIYTIREWEKHIHKLKPKRHPKTNWRYYTEEDINIIRQIKYLLRNRKIRLKGINAELLKIERLGDTILDRAGVLNLIRQIRVELNEVRSLVESILDKE